MIIMSKDDMIDVDDNDDDDVVVVVVVVVAVELIVCSYSFHVAISKLFISAFSAASI